MVFFLFLAFVWVFIPFLDEEDARFVPPVAAFRAPEETAFFAPAAPEPDLRAPPEAREAAARPAPLPRDRFSEPLPFRDFASLSKPAGLRRCSVLLMLPIRSMLPL